jgi:hypothetical protein
VHGPAVRLGGLPDDGQAEPRTGQPTRVRGAVEAVEDVRQILGREARPVVAHGDDAVAYADLDRLAGRAPFQRVVQQVRDRAV